MKQSLLPILVVALFLISCGQHNASSTFMFKVQNLKSAFILLDTDSAYTLKTPKGAIVRIAQNTFDVKENEKIKLEIKEAYSIADMLLAGLTTKSNNRLLNSGGMIYINATVNGRDVKINKPISVSIPAANYDSRMQLFKGEVDTNGSINWIDPQPLNSSQAARNIIDGEILFKANCASCHKPTKDFTAPALAYCRDREPDRDWAYRFTKNPAAMRETDKYANAIFQRYNKTQMTAFGNQLNRNEVNAILDYCDNYALTDSFPANTATENSSNTSGISNCGYDTMYFSMPDTSIKVLPAVPALDTTPVVFPENNIEIPMYEFNIDRSGWYNVDCFADVNKAIVTNVSLSVNLNMPGELNLQVYLCVPIRKLLTDGMKMENKSFVFYEPDGSVPLILNDEAIIIAVGADSATAYYGIERFIVQSNQVITINLKASTKEEILKSIKSNKLGDIKIEVN